MKVVDVAVAETAVEVVADVVGTDIVAVCIVVAVIGDDSGVKLERWAHSFGDVG